MAALLFLVGWKEKSRFRKEVADITMNFKIKPLGGPLCFLLAIVLLAAPGKAFAEENECTVTLPVSVEVSHTSAPVDTEFEVLLMSADADAPMPEISSGTVKGAGRIVFGPISYRAPGDYHYNISQKTGSTANYIYDTAVYTVTVRVVNSEDGGLTAEVWAAKNGAADKAEAIVFNNEYKAPSDSKTPEKLESTPKTGDGADVRLFMALTALSAATLALIGWKTRREKRSFH